MEKKWICVALAAALLAGLFSGCGTSASPEAGLAAGESTGDVIALAESEETPNLSVDFYTLSDSNLRDFSRTEDGYLAVIEGSEILRIDLDFSVQSQTEFSSSIDGAHRLYAYQEIDGAVYTLEDSWTMDKSYVGKDHQLWLETEYARSCAFARGTAGVIFLCVSGSLYCGDEKLELPGPMESGDFFQAATLFHCGQNVCAVLHQMSPDDEAPLFCANYLCTLDDENKISLGTVLPLTEPVTAACSDGEAVYLLCGDTVYRLLNETLTVYADLVSLGISGSGTLRMLSIEDGSLILAQTGGLAVLRERTGDETPAETKILRLAVPESVSDLVSDAAASYNRLGTGYTVEIISFPDEGDTMSLAIASGEQFDIICETDLHKMRSYAKKGVFLPLDEMVFLQSEDLFQNILDLYRVENTLYYFAPNFWVSCIRLPADMTVGGTLTAERLYEISESLNLYSYLTNSAVLQLFLTANGIEQWTTQGGFLGSDFPALLEYCSHYADWNTVELYPDTEGELSPTEILCYYPLPNWNLEYLRSREELCEFYYGCDVAYVPYPFSGYKGVGAGSSGFGYFCVCTNAHVDGAQSFLEYLVSSEFYAQASGDIMYGSFPLRRSACDFQDGDKTSERMLALIEIADHINFISQQENEIIYEEAETYFNGECTAEECASRIQSRIDIYLSEQS